MASAEERGSAIAQALLDLAQQLAQKRGAADRVQAQLSRWQDEQQKLTDDVAVLEQTAAILLALEGAWRKDFEESLARVVSDGLSLVFNEGLHLRIESSTKAGASAIEFKLETGDGETDIMSAEGGSVVQVVSFLLRLLLILAHRPALRKTLIMDEPFGGLSEENLPALVALLRKLVDDTGMQIIMVTHEQAFGEYADVVYEVKRKNGVGKVKQLKTHNEVCTQ